MLHDTFNLIQFFPFSDFNFFHKNLLKVYLYIKKDQNGLIFFDFIKNCPEYSDIQDLTNGLSALDTRVTNAINGGDLAPPFEYNYLISNYITNKDGGIVTTADTASAWTFYDTGHPSTGTKYGMARTWPTQTAIKRNYKLVVNISAPVNGPVIELLNASGAAVVTISNLNSTTDLSQFAGQTLYPRFRGTYGYNNGARRTINFNTLKIFKQ